MELKKILEGYKEMMEKELEAILSFWMNNAVDEINGGFIGQINFANEKINNAPKGSVLNARILWAFSAAYNLTKKKEYEIFAKRAFDYIIAHFIDKENGGVYWTVDEKGNPLDTKKQVYALAFTIYAFSEFYKIGNNEKALLYAIEIYDTIIKYSYDKKQLGYIEAFTSNWEPIEDLRLSSKDANEKKTMNTHLHVMEAFTTLYSIAPSVDLKEKLKEIIEIFINKIVNKNTYHQHLFFDENWQSKFNIISYGHDIEAAWLLQEAAEMLGDETLIFTAKKLSVQMANAAAKGLDDDGGLWYEYEPDVNFLIKEKHNWPQAEAMVGFFNAWQNTNQAMYLQKSMDSWKFVQKHILDKKNGEWHWGVHENYTAMQQDKVGIWKCPYHNSRACIEIIKRINTFENKTAL